MRKAINLIVAVTILTASALISACSTTGSVLGKTITEKKDLANFTNVDINGVFDFEISQSETFSTTVSADESLFDYITVTKDEETLRIYLKPRHPFSDFTLLAKTLKAKITMPALHKLRLSGATKGTISGFKSATDFSVTISGASSLAIKNLETGNTIFDVSGASKITGNMNAGDAKLEISGASQLELAGSANNLILTASGASRASLIDFQVSTANVKLSGVSEATIKVKEKLDAVLRDASRLYFQGNPAMGNIELSGASTIKHK